jgi:hypothetical protein
MVQPSSSYGLTCPDALRSLTGSGGGAGETTLGHGFGSVVARRRHGGAVSVGMAWD